MEQVVLWSGGGRYLVPSGKVAVNAAIAQLPGGILVDWGGGDTEILSGATSQTSQFLTATDCEGTGKPIVQRKYYPNGGTWNATFPSPFGTGSGMIGEDSIGWLVDFGDCLGARWRAIYSRRPSTCRGYCYTFQSSTGGVTLTGSAPVYAVKTDLGGKSWRQQNTPPVVSLQNAGCAISIAFSDNSTKQIPLDYCPEWVQIKPANACPDETVKQCDHGATTCCYGCVNGRLKLIDSFNKTQG